jgi:outer membrane immunogenic protein
MAIFCAIIVARGILMKKLATAITAIALIGTPAFAADMAVKAPPPAPAPVAPVVDWTGFYVGGNIGGVLENASGTSDFTDTTPNPSNPQNDSFSKAGFLGGGQAGYNYQIAPLVVGVEGDWDWTDTKYSFCRQTDPGSAACFDNSNGFETIGSKTDWLATLRGRLGVTWGNLLFYGTGGAAWGRVNTDLTLSCLVDGCGATSLVKLFSSSTNSDTKSGWVAGLGAEYMLARNWSVRAEWLHIDLGTISDSLSTVGSSGTIQTAVWSRTERFDQFRVGVNYLFH